MDEADSILERVAEVVELIFERLDEMASDKRVYLNKEQILGQDDLVTEDVQVPEWGGAWVRVRTLNASERDNFEAGSIVGKGKNATLNFENMRARLCLLTLIDEKGDRLFREEDTFPLGGKSAAALDRIFTVAQRLNGLRTEDLEELAKNSKGDQPDASLID